MLHAKRKLPIKKRINKASNYIWPPEARVFLIEEYLKKGKKPEEAMVISCEKCYSDNVTVMINEENLWPGNHTLVQSGRLAYDILWQFEKEGRLKKEVRIQERQDGIRHRYYFWLSK